MSLLCDQRTVLSLGMLSAVNGLPSRVPAGAASSTLAPDAVVRSTGVLIASCNLDYAYKGSTCIDQSGPSFIQSDAASKFDAQPDVSREAYSTWAQVPNVATVKTCTGIQLRTDFLTGLPYGVRVGLAKPIAFGQTAKYLLQQHHGY